MSILEDIEQELFENSDGNEENAGDPEAGDVNEAAENDQDAEQAKRVARVKKAIARHPRPKLDSDRLCGERGIPLLPNLFEKVTFKGNGHEKEDLDKMMKILEHWAHRLFPKYTFDDVLAKIEKLGTKKPVQTCIKKIRLDMPIHYNDKEIYSEGEEPTNETCEPSHEQDVNQDAMFDELINQYNSNPIVGERPPSPVFNATPQSGSEDLTSDQRSRIEQNRRLAEERRRAKLDKQQTVEDNFEDVDAALSTDFFEDETLRQLEADETKCQQNVTSNDDELETIDAMIDLLDEDNQ